MDGTFLGPEMYEHSEKLYQMYRYRIGSVFWVILRTGPVCTGSVFWKICTGPDRIGFLKNLYRIGSDFLYRILPFHTKWWWFYHDFIDAKTSKISTQKHQKYQRKNIKKSLKKLKAFHNVHLFLGSKWNLRSWFLHPSWWFSKARLTVRTPRPQKGDIKRIINKKWNLSETLLVLTRAPRHPRSSSWHPAGEGNRHRRPPSSPCLPPERWVSSLPWTTSP